MGFLSITYLREKLKIEQHLILNETKEDDGNKEVKTDQLKNLRTPYAFLSPPKTKPINAALAWALFTGQ